jgi:thiamine biosynthesis lipoprotein ApbE
MKRWIFLVLPIMLALLIQTACVPLNPAPPVTFTAGHELISLYGAHSLIPNSQILSTISDDLSPIIIQLDPSGGGVLNKLNESESGEIIPAGPVTSTFEKLLASTRNCFGTFDPTLQILYDVYDFAGGGRYVPDDELSRALQWVDYHNIEMDRGGILRKNDIVRTGFGPTLPAAIADLAIPALIDSGMRAGRLEAGNCVAVWGANTEPFTYDVKYPLGNLSSSEPQLTIGHIKLASGEFLAAVDDYTGVFFAHGESFHMLLDPRTGRPEHTTRAAIVISKDSCLQAAVYACGLMVMDLDRGMKFLDETEGVSGLILTEDHELKVSGSLGERFWR